MDSIRDIAFRTINITIYQSLTRETLERERRAEVAMSIPQGEGNLPGSWPALTSLFGPSITDVWRSE